MNTIVYPIQRIHKPIKSLRYCY